jgi:hypothetical protein
VRIPQRLDAGREAEEVYSGINTPAAQTATDAAALMIARPKCRSQPACRLGIAAYSLTNAEGWRYR